MVEKLQLYRGDYTAIETFKVCQTNRGSLVGPGIYLTDSPKVAATYCVKGLYTANMDMKEHVLFTGPAKNRPDALDKAFFTWLRFRQDKSIRGIVYNLTTETMGSLSPKTRSLIEDYRARFDTLVTRGVIVADYSRKVGVKEITVKYTPEEKLGYITKFDFNKHEFEISMFNLERPTDLYFWEMVWEKKVDFCLLPIKEYRDKNHFIDSNLGCRQQFVRAKANSIFPCNLGIKVWNGLRNILKPYGYRGFEYAGGRHVGGMGFHRAFCVWDDEWVNQHFTERFR